jgi:hypothetical protein
MTTTHEAELPATEPRAARWEDFIDIYTAPGAVYRRRREDTPVPALLVLLGMALVLSVAFLPLTRRVIEAALAEQGTAVPDSVVLIMQIGGLIGGVVMTLFLVAGAAALLWLGTRLVDVELAFSRTFLVATYAGFVMLLSQIAGAVLLAMHDGGPIDPVRDLSFGMLRFFDPEAVGPLAAAALARLEPFGIWQAALWWIGVREVGRTTADKAAVVAVFAWIVMALPNLLFGTLGGAR